MIWQEAIAGRNAPELVSAFVKALTELSHFSHLKQEEGGQTIFQSCLLQKDIDGQKLCHLVTKDVGK